MAKIIIFGTGQIAQLANYYFHTDTEHDVVGFTVDRPYLGDSLFEGKPVVPFDEVESIFSPTEYKMFVALSYAKVNQVREEKYRCAKIEKGYSFVSYISSRCSYLSQYNCGDNCFILEDNTIQPFVKIGNNVVIWSGNHIGHHSVIHDHCFIASHVVVSGDVQIGEFCFIGVNATLRDHIKIGEKSVLGAGALILADVEPGGVYISTATERSKVPSSRLRKI